MSAAASPGRALPARRKIRKGTQSCWECKRRKIRCTFASPADAVCDGCKSRQTRCVGQEYEDESRPAAAAAARKVDRLKRMESIVEDLVNHSKHDDCVGEDGHGEARCAHRRRRAGTRQKQKFSDPDAERRASVSSIPLGLEATTPPEELSRYLVSLWPRQSDLDLVVGAQVCTAFLLYSTVCQPYHGFIEKHTACIRRGVRRPAVGTHPVLVARSMMLIVTLLDSLPSTLDGLAVPQREMKERLYGAATRLVTSNHELMACLEGLESHLMELTYLANMGNLRRAWLVNRRAMALAQMMGLQRGGGATTSSSSSSSTSSVVVLEQATLERVRPEYMWFRLVSTDRHLSLLLGLPQATTENVFATPEVLETHAPLERFERILVVACSLILQRNDADHSGDLDTTYEIDKTLQRAAALLTPPQWWLASPAAALTRLAGDDDAAAFQETTRLINQFIYHHLLVQLHLPYILLPSTTADPRVDCSKMTVANASRAILARFVAFHGSPAASSSYCRAIDFFAFVASTTLCLVHIEARRQQCLGRANAGGGFSLLQPLLHQRHGDRAILQDLLSIVAGMAQTGPDPISKRIIGILGPLLEIELNSFRGGCYSVSAVGCREASSDDADSSKPEPGAASDFGDSSSAPHILRIKIPYFGTIRIQHHPELSLLANSARSNGKGQGTQLSVDQDFGISDSGSSVISSVTPPAPHTDCAVRTQTLEGGWTSSSALLEQSSSLIDPKNEGWAENAASFCQGDVSESCAFAPSLSSDEHWALQGVDIALFSNLKQGP
ncbi:hypothetical protein V2A60_008642 [Cordyceps javanica]